MLGPHYNPVRMLEVVDCRTFAKKLGIGHNGKISSRIDLADDAFNLVAGANGNRRFGNYHAKTRQRGGNLTGRSIDEAKISVTVATTRRRAYGDEDGIGRSYGLGKVGRKGEPPA